MDRGVCNALRLLLRRKFHPAEYDAFVPVCATMADEYCCRGQI
jgi:hypothetical protein